MRTFNWLCIFCTDVFLTFLSQLGHNQWELKHLQEPGNSWSKRSGVAGGSTEPDSAFPARDVHILVVLKTMLAKEVTGISMLWIYGLPSIFK